MPVLLQKRLPLLHLQTRQIIQIIAYRGSKGNSPTSNEIKALPAHQGQLPAPPTRSGVCGKGKKGKGRGKGNKAAPQVKPGAKTFDQIKEHQDINRQFFHPTQNKTGICWSFQKGQCTANPCCIGCGKPNVAYESCHCIDHLVSVSA